MNLRTVLGAGALAAASLTLPLAAPASATPVQQSAPAVTAASTYHYAVCKDTTSNSWPSERYVLARNWFNAVLRCGQLVTPYGDNYHFAGWL